MTGTNLPPQEQTVSTVDKSNVKKNHIYLLHVVNGRKFDISTIIYNYMNLKYIFIVHVQEKCILLNEARENDINMQPNKSVYKSGSHLQFHDSVIHPNHTTTTKEQCNKIKLTTARQLSKI